jgi:hypothetical protein
MRRGSSRVLAPALLLCAVAACGSTVPTSQQQADSGTTGLAGGALSLGTATGGPGAGASLAQPGARAGQQSTPGTAPGTEAGRSRRSATPPSGPVGARGGREPVRIGFTTAPDASAFFKAFGADVSTGDQSAELRAAVAWVNAHGGLNGHPLEPVVEAVSATSSEPYDQQYQQLCTKYTQDEHVTAAAMVGIGADTNMDRCMTKAHTLFVTGSNTLHDDSDYARSPYVVSPSEVTASTVASAMIHLILDRGYEKRGGKVGLLNFDIPARSPAGPHSPSPCTSATR